MNYRKTRQNFIGSMLVILCVVIAFVSTISAQIKNEGKLNVWTDNLVQPNHEDSVGCLTNIRVSKNKGFDRMVFEFKGGLNSYTFY